MSAAVSTRSALDSSGYMRGTQQKLVRCAGEVRRCGGLNYHSGAHGALGTVLSMPTSGSLSLLLQAPVQVVMKSPLQDELAEVKIICIMQI